MARPLTDTQRKNILESFSEWSLDNGIYYSRDAAKTVQAETEFTLDGFLDELRGYLADGGDVGQLAETREEYKWRGVRYEIRGVFGKRRIYLYFYLDKDSDRDPAKINIASVHCDD